jgi:hypothetical protein
MLPTIRSISARGMRASRPTCTTLMRPALIHRRTATGCKASSWAAAPIRKTSCPCFAIGISRLQQKLKLVACDG